MSNETLRGDYTLAEVKRICKESQCKTCRLNPAKRPMCPLNAAPQFWPLSGQTSTQAVGDGGCGQC